MLTWVYPPGLVDRVVAACGCAEQRKRLLPARLVVYFVLELALLLDQRIKGVLHHHHRHPHHDDDGRGLDSESVVRHHGCQSHRRTGRGWSRPLCLFRYQRPACLHTPAR
nr:transposase domain-containing protein [Streptomyces griseochromogenes]